MESQRLAQQTMAFILAGGRGSRLMELTERRAKPAVYFGGKSRIIDFPLSNAVNSGIKRLGVATQYKAHSLIRHLQRGWSFFRAERNESLDILPASQQLDEENWYKGTADAVYQNIPIIDGNNPKYVIVLAGDHIYKQDYSLMIQQHVLSGHPLENWDPSSCMCIVLSCSLIYLRQQRLTPNSDETSPGMNMYSLFDQFYCTIQPFCLKNCVLLI